MPSSAYAKATAEANNLAAKAVSKEFYIRAMEQHCGGDRPYIHPNQLDVLHQEVSRQSIEKFRCARKMGGEALSQNYQQDLDTEVQELYGNPFSIIVPLQPARLLFSLFRQLQEAQRFEERLRLQSNADHIHLLHGHLLPHRRHSGHHLARRIEFRLHVWLLGLFRSTLRLALHEILRRVLRSGRVHRLFRRCHLEQCKAQRYPLTDDERHVLSRLGFSTDLFTMPTFGHALSAWPHERRLDCRAWYSDMDGFYFT